MSKGPRVPVFTGDGKGKTTAALGMALRAAGHGLRTCVVQFVKSDATVGEIAAAAAFPSIDIHTTGLGFLPPPAHPDFPRHREAAQAGLNLAFDAITGGQYAVVVLDEVCLAVARGLIDESQVADLVAFAPAESCLVLTGRDAAPGLVALADTVTEMRCVKHGLSKGIVSQNGVER